VLFSISIFIIFRTILAVKFASSHFQLLVASSIKIEQLRNDRKVSADYTEVFVNDLENRAKDLNIYDLRPFYQSALFRSHGLRVDERRQVIIKQY
jgi:hypothetical protein